MNGDVPYLRREVIESEAGLVLAEYGREHGKLAVLPPSPLTRSSSCT